MKPIRTDATDVCYRAQHPKIGDLWVQQLKGGACRTVWEPTANELAMLLNGGRVTLLVVEDPPPPIGVGVLPAEECVPVGPYRFKNIPELDDVERG